jgi:pimeloyl-ACP methyl ester carboxylesterase
MVPGELSVLMRMATPRRYSDTAFLSAAMGTMYGGKMRQADARMRESVAHEMRPTSKRGYLFQQLALAGWSSLPWLPLVRQRTLIMAGDDDPLVPLINAKLMARLLPRAELQVFHDGHMLIFTSQALAVAAVRDFLEAASARTRSRAGHGIDSQDCLPAVRPGSGEPRSARSSGRLPAQPPGRRGRNFSGTT